MRLLTHAFGHKRALATVRFKHQQVEERRELGFFGVLPEEGLVARRRGPAVEILGFEGDEPFVQGHA